MYLMDVLVLLKRVSGICLDMGALETLETEVMSPKYTFFMCRRAAGGFLVT